MSASVQRWVSVTDSQFDHEAEGLRVIKDLLPNADPYYAWANFEFRDGSGHWHEVDVAVLGPDALHLIELKHYHGRLSGDDHTWRRGSRVEESPLKLTRRKAQRLASKLKSECRSWLAEEMPRSSAAQRDDFVKKIVPFVKESVFLHAENDFVCTIPEASARGLFGLDHKTDETNLRGISELLLAPPDRTRLRQRHTPIGPNQAALFAQLMQRIGVKRREQEAGQWVLKGAPIEDGDRWQEWRVEHKLTNQPGIARVYPLPTRSTAEVDLTRQIVKHEYALMNGLRHAGILAPNELVETSGAPTLIFANVDPDKRQRLDLWRARSEAKNLSLGDHIKMITKIAEALEYAHTHDVAHRALTPHSVFILPGRDGTPQVNIGNWAYAGYHDQPDGDVDGVTTHLAALDAIQNEKSVQNEESQYRERFAAPESTASNANRILADVFALGALAYFIITGEAPAENRQDLINKLQDSQSLYVSECVAGVPAHVVNAISHATAGKVNDRTLSARKFLEEITALELTATELPQEAVDPLEAEPGTSLAGRFTVQRKLGQGATAVALKVIDNSVTVPASKKSQSIKLQTRIVKVGLDDRANQLLAAEARVLEQLASIKSPYIVTMDEGPIRLGPREALVLRSAGDVTLAEHLRSLTHLPLESLKLLSDQLVTMLEQLESAGVMHRDIKPANIGVKGQHHRQKLVLFDFSLSEAPAHEIAVGTRAYLDPFLGTVKRSGYDAAADRFSASVVLFEMATGQRPVFGDGRSDPQVTSDTVTIDESMFDDAVAKQMVRFFSKAFARDVADRFQSATELARDWRRIFTDDLTSKPSADNDVLAQQAHHETLLVASGLTASAVSALRNCRLGSEPTVGDLLLLQQRTLDALPGVSGATKDQLKRRYREWKARLGVPESPVVESVSLDNDYEALKSALGKKTSLVSFVRILFGRTTAELEPLAATKEVADAFAKPVSPGRVRQMWREALQLWDADPAASQVIQRAGDNTEQAVQQLGGFATVTEVERWLAEFRYGDQPLSNTTHQNIAGLVWVAIVALRQDASAEDRKATVAHLRRGEKNFLALDPEVIDALTALAPVADRQVNGEAPNDVVQPAAAARRLLNAPQASGLPTGLRSPHRITSATTKLTREAYASRSGVLYHQNISIPTLLKIIFDDIATDNEVDADGLRERLRREFPMSFPHEYLLPSAQQLPKLVQAANVGWRWDAPQNRFLPPQVTASTVGLVEKSQTAAYPAHVIGSDAVSNRMVETARRRSFAAFGVPGKTRLREFEQVATAQFDVQVLNVAELVIGELKAVAADAGAQWSAIVACDEPSASVQQRNAFGQALAQTKTRVVNAIDKAVDAVGPPLLLSDVALLARFGWLSTITGLSDLGRERGRAVWVVFPQSGVSSGSKVDGEVVPLGSPNMYVQVSSSWVAEQRASLRTGQPKPGEGSYRGAPSNGAAFTKHDGEGSRQVEVEAS